MGIVYDGFKSRYLKFKLSIKTIITMYGQIISMDLLHAVYDLQKYGIMYFCMF